MKHKVALALGSGGARGLAHIGVIEELENQGFEITSVSGSSMGSLIAGFYVMSKFDIIINIPSNSARTFEFHKAP
jgi:NTE family protein